MKTAPEADGAGAPMNAEPTAEQTPELHHGDLRKGAYLRRRASYQMAASSPPGRQAGEVIQPPAASLPRQRKPR